MSKQKSRVVEVEIYDQRYSIVLQRPLDETEVRQMAAELDRRMREISSASSSPDSLKVAVLTALHLCQELHDLKNQYAQSDALICSKSDQWAHALEQVLKK